MKKPVKTKKPAIKKARAKSISKDTKLVSFRLSEHKHTGKLIHHRHTSHIALIGILLLTGLFLYFNKSEVLAEQSSSVSVSVIVPGPPPTKGAMITSPKDGETFTDNNIIEVKGTCVEGTFVVIKSNNTVIGSTICKQSEKFDLKVQLLIGKNSLSALNYDNLNQAGPVTPPVAVSVIKTITESKTETSTTTKTNNAQLAPSNTPTEVVVPVIPSNPSIIPGVSSNITNCDDYKSANLTTGGEPHVAVVCVPRLFEPKLEQVLGVIVWGGTPPYAVSVNWGDGSDETLISLKSQSYRKETFSYKNAGNYNITFRLKDSTGNTAIVQTAVQVNGAVTAPVTPISALTNELFNTSWLKTPVPLYVLAVTVTLGFWGGDIFDRYFGAKKAHHKRRKIAHS